MGRFDLVSGRPVLFLHGRGLVRGVVDVRCVMRDDEDVLQAAKELAASRRMTAGQVLSELARKGLAPHGAARMRNGVPLLPRRPPGARRPTMKQVNELRDVP